MPNAPLLVPVADEEHPGVAPFREMRERDLAGRTGVFVAEGEVVLRLLLSPRSLYRPVSLLLSTARAAALAELLGRLDPDCPVHVASPDVLARIAGFPVHRGVLALAARGAPSDAGALLAGLPHRALVLALAGLANHDNVGGCFRNGAAFGADAVLLDATCCDPLYRKAVRVSVGTALTLPFARAGSAEDMVSLLDRHGFSVLALSPAGREPVVDVAWRERTALLVGTEGAGLPTGILARARSVRIAMATGVDSLNVATASGIALAAAWAARSRSGSAGS